jgi:hypothetical protein
LEIQQYTGSDGTKEVIFFFADPSCKAEIQKATCVIEQKNGVDVGDVSTWVKRVRPLK